MGRRRFAHPDRAGARCNQGKEHEHEQPDWVMHRNAGDDDVYMARDGMKFGWEVIIMGKSYKVVGVGPDSFRNYLDQPHWV